MCITFWSERVRAPAVGLHMLVENVVATINTIIGPSEVHAPAVGVAHAGGERSGLY